MGAYLEKPITSKTNRFGKGNQLVFGSSSMQGWRFNMEDSTFAAAEMDDYGTGPWSFFAVFDGHGGKRISEYCAANMLSYILNTKEWHQGEYTNAIRTAFLRIDAYMLHHPELHEEANNTGGTTAICALISSNTMYIANCGDSRAVICKSGSPLLTTIDHKPYLHEERRRIRNAGGNVFLHRVNGTLAVSRALGDFEFKKVKTKNQVHQVISPEPEVYAPHRESKNEFLILACDGVWDVMSNENVCKYLHWRFKISEDVVQIADEVLDICLHMGSRDNMSIIIIAFPGAPKPDSDALEAYYQLVDKVSGITRKILTENKVAEYPALMRLLESKNISDLPPGGGLYALYPVIEEIFKEFYPEKASESPLLAFGLNN